MSNEKEKIIIKTSSFVTHNCSLLIRKMSHFLVLHILKLQPKTTKKEK